VARLPYLQSRQKAHRQNEGQEMIVAIHIVATMMINCLNHCWQANQRRYKAQLPLQKNSTDDQTSRTFT
jgi:hypothetical protein